MTRGARGRLAAALLVGLALGCASAPRDERPRVRDPLAARARVADAAASQVGAPYRPGGHTPAGFDCSGLVVWSYAQAGVHGLPRSATALDERSRSVALDAIEPGDLLFFELGASKAQHVGIYVGGRSFVHAPSSGKAVERVGFEHVYWRKQLRRAGRLLD